MAISAEQIAFVEDLFADVGPIATRKTFGGLGIHTGGKIFALLMSDGAVKLKGVGDVPAGYAAKEWVA